MGQPETVDADHGSRPMVRCRSKSKMEIILYIRRRDLMLNSERPQVVGPGPGQQMKMCWLVCPTFRSTTSL